MYLCIYVCMYLCMYVCIYVCMYILVLSRSIDKYRQNLDNGLFGNITIYPISKKYRPCLDKRGLDFAADAVQHVWPRGLVFVAEVQFSSFKFVNKRTKSH